ncbi:MAG: hypothetical protein CVU34_16260 [Betaproteobacteria bacterium HGW-Betaproteobacteria-7]|nr:MAG: hypothetical protein CVU34_16260 [Betaproteobacteria bacterium HGW-Betaproteobacteria-7]
MIEALRDPVWQFAGVVVSLTALLVAIAAIRLQLIRKSLAFHHSMDRPVFFVFNPELRGRLHITFDGREVQRLSSFELHIFNDGNAPIAPADFIQPISVEFTDGAHIFGVMTTETSSPDLGVQITRKGVQFTVEPLLLNPGDAFSLQFLIELPDDDQVVQPQIHGRVTGVKCFSRKPFRSGRRTGYYIFRSALVLVPAGIGLLAGLFGNWAFSQVLSWLSHASGG